MSEVAGEGRRGFLGFTSEEDTSVASLWLGGDMSSGEFLAKGYILSDGISLGRPGGRCVLWMLWRDIFLWV